MHLNVRFLVILLATLSVSTLTMSAQTATVICDSGCGGQLPGGSVVTSSKSIRGRGSPLHPAANPMQPLSGAENVALPGSQSFTYAVPLFALPGRNGLDINLTLYYNSFIWTASGNSITLNALHDNPSPGFYLSFGYIDISDQSGTILVDSTGVAHNLVAVTGFSYVTNDSTYIQVQFSQDFSTAVATYKSGLKVNYSLDPTRSIFRPVQFEDTNGNTVSVIYNNDNTSTANTQLGQIHDSLGRTLFFKYDDATKKMLNFITEVSAGGAQIKTYTFNWQLNYPLNFAFTEDTGTLRSGVLINVLQSVTRPNGTKVKFDYGDWGIVNKVEELSGNGALRYSTSYNFPPASAGALSSNPAYTQQTVYDGVNTGTWTHNIQRDADGLATSSSITDPFGTTRTTNFLPASAGTSLQGLPNQVLICSSSPCTSTATTLLRTINSVWQSDASGANPRRTSVTTILEDGTTQSENILAYDANGNLTDLQEFDYGSGQAGALIKETVTSYASLGNGILNRPSRVVVQYGAGVAVERTDISYDEGTLTDVSPNPVGHDSAFGTGQTARGNPTTIKRYANASAGTGGITTKLTYDVLGNVLTSQPSNGAQTSQIFSAATQFAFPDSISIGPTGNQLVSSFTYNSDGQLLTTTDANQQKSSFIYDPAGRLATVQTPDQITATTSFDDLAAAPSKTVSSTANSAVTKVVFDGLGRNLGQQLLNGSTLVSTTSQTNDILGRPTEITIPYGPGVGYSPTFPPPFTSYVYDALGRATQVTPPSVEGAVQNPYITTYSGATVTTTDPAGKMKRLRSNSLGRLVEVDEPGLIGGQAAQGSVTILGRDLSTPTSSGNGATAGTASITVQPVNSTKDANGSFDRSTQVLTHNATVATGSVTITGSEQIVTNTIDPCADGGGSCPRDVTVYDTGTVSMTVNGITQKTSYGSFTQPSDIASALAGAFASNGTFTVSASGNVVTVKANSAGIGGNSITLSASSATSETTCTNFCSPSFVPQASGSTLAGGTSNGYTLTYDTGNISVSVGVNGTTYTKIAKYDQNSDGTKITNDLFSQFVNDSNFSAVVRVTPPGTGNILQFTTIATGSGTNDPLTTSSVTTSSNFAAGSTSFTISPLGSSTFQPGQNGTLYDSGTITATLTGVSMSAMRETITYGQGSDASGVAALMSAAFNKDPFSPVTASVAPGSSTINFTAKDRGTDANYFSISIAGQSSLPAGTFSGTSFPPVSGSLSGGVDPTPSLDPSVALVTKYSYDGAGNLLQVVQGQQTRTYRYDGLGRKTSEQVPETLNVATTATYQDSTPVTTTLTDPRGITATSSYDVFGRFTGVTFSDGTPAIGYTYGAASATDLSAGRPTQITDAAGSESYQYDNMGRVVKCTRVIGNNIYVTSYAYTNGQLSSITYPSGRIINITPDAIGRLNQISTGGANLLSIGSYSASGQILTDTYGNGMQGSYGYNDQQQLSSIQYRNSSSTIMSLSYAYGGAQDDGLIAGITDSVIPARSTSYVYDELSRLKRAGTVDLTSPNTWLLKYAYDRYGNRLAQIPSAGTAAMPASQLLADSLSNRITSFGTYDAAGNMTNDGIHTYTFNALNQITKVDGANASVYDYSGRRVISNGNYEIYSGSNVIAEYANTALAASPSAEHVYLSGQRLATIAGGTTTYHYWDHLSIRATADAQGNVVRTYGHFPFGKTWYETGAPNKFKFTTYEQDAASGLDYAQQRFDSPFAGRFMSLDPLLGSVGNPQSLNRYAYVLNNPINLVDPNGLRGAAACLISATGEASHCIGGDCTVDGQTAINCGNLGEFAGGVSFGSCPPDCGVGQGITTSSIYGTLINTIDFGFTAYYDCLDENVEGNDCGMFPGGGDGGQQAHCTTTPGGGKGGVQLDTCQTGPPQARCEDTPTGTVCKIPFPGGRVDQSPLPAPPSYSGPPLQHPVDTCKSDFAKGAAIAGFLSFAFDAATLVAGPYAPLTKGLSIGLKGLASVSGGIAAFVCD